MLKGDKGWRRVLLRSTGTILEYHLEIKRIKKIYISVKPEGVIVTAPIGVTLQGIEECLNHDAEAILRAKERMEKKVAQVNEKKKQLAEKQELEFLGGNLPFEIVQAPQSKVELGANGLILYMKDAHSVEERDQLIDKFYTEQCKKLFPKLLQEQYRNFLHYYAIPVPKLKIRDMKTRWGSCNVLTADVTLNKKIIRAPKKVIEMIIVHELSHLVERGHNQRFYRVMTTVMPQWKMYEAHLEKTSDGWFF